jgi:cytochrome c-type biogenesis protein CcmH/NrfG
MALGGSGRYADAADAFGQARDLDPEHARTRFQLALALYADHRNDALGPEIETLNRLDPTLGKELHLILGF